MRSQVFYTVLSGVLVFVLGQILQKFFLEPLQTYKKTVGEIDNKLKFYANILVNRGFNQKTLNNVANTMRTLSCQIESEYKQIPFTEVLSQLGFIESKENIAKVSQGLIFLSNAGGKNDIETRECGQEINQIREILKIETLN
jgi:hypothetical protein